MKTDESNAVVPSSSESQSSSAVIVDALPYIDTDYDANARQAAVALIEEECKRYRPTKNYLAHLPVVDSDVFMTPLLRAEFERMERGQPMEVLSVRRYELPPPGAGRKTDPTAWLEAVSNSESQLEHQMTRIVNLELMEEFGAEQYKRYNGTLQRLVDGAEKELNQLKRAIQSVNFERKRKQVEAGERLSALEQGWVQLVAKNYQIESACVELDNELAPLRKKHKQVTAT